MRVYITSFLVFSFSLFVLIGCGYKPTTYYAKKELGTNSKYYVNMAISVNSAKNSVNIKDAVNEAIINKFGGKLVYNKKDADTIMDISLNSVSTSAIQYDTDPDSDSYGYANLYRTTVSIKVSYKTKTSSATFSVSDYYEFAVEGSTSVSDTKKYQAIKAAASKAFDKVVSSIAVRSFKTEEEKNNSHDNNSTKKLDVKKPQ